MNLYVIVLFMFFHLLIVFIEMVVSVRKMSIIIYNIFLFTCLLYFGNNFICLCLCVSLTVQPIFDLFEKL